MSKLTYKNSGVDVGLADQLIGQLQKRLRQSIKSPQGQIGDFGAVYPLGNSLLVSGVDGVGTKLKIAFLMKKHNTVGIDLVAMNVNDILTKGAKPLFFMDYLATGKIQPEIFHAILKGIAKGCTQAGCALIGGETAEMPDFYKKGEYDLAGFAVGITTKKNIIMGNRVKAGDAILGLPSSGLHSNGYSLVRKLFFKKLGYTVDSYVPELKATAGQILLKPTKIYVPEILRVIKAFPKAITGMAHITGGGMRNIARINTEKGYVLDRMPRIPALFRFIQSNGPVEWEEIFQTLNMGIGFVLISARPDRIRKIIPAARIIGYVDDLPRVSIPKYDIEYPN